MSDNISRSSIFRSKMKLQDEKRNKEQTSSILEKASLPRDEALERRLEAERILRGESILLASLKDEENDIER